MEHIHAVNQVWDRIHFASTDKHRWKMGRKKQQLQWDEWDAV